VQRECGIELEASLHRRALDFCAQMALPQGAVSAGAVAGWGSCLRVLKMVPRASVPDDR
jgi:hypothetical protein